MVAVYGMSERIGLVSCVQRQSAFLDGEMQRDCSEETAREIDEEVKVMLDEAYAKTKEILAAHRDQLEKIAGELLKKERSTARVLQASRQGNAARERTSATVAGASRIGRSRAPAVASGGPASGSVSRWRSTADRARDCVYFSWKITSPRTRVDTVATCALSSRERIALGEALLVPVGIGRRVSRWRRRAWRPAPA